jgi:hypothetical protein
MLTPQHALPLHDEIVVDNFAGGGGASTGIERALGRPVDVAINHDPEAVALHSDLPIHRTGVQLLTLAIKAQAQMPRAVKRHLGDKLQHHCAWRCSTAWRWPTPRSSRSAPRTSRSCSSTSARPSCCCQRIEREVMPWVIRLCRYPDDAAEYNAILRAIRGEKEPT